MCGTASLLCCPKQVLFKQINCVFVNIWRKERGRRKGGNEVGVCGFNVSFLWAAALQRLLSQECCLRLF